MKRKILSTLGAACLSALALSSCSSSEDSGLKIYLAYGNGNRGLLYEQSQPITLPDGTVVSPGDLKPAWQHIESQLGIDIEVVGSSAKKATEMISQEASNGFVNSVIFGGGSCATNFMDYGANNNFFIRLDEYLDQMPDFQAYLEENPSIATSITAYDGHIYYIPYIAEIGNYARLYHVRKSWVTDLLDAPNANFQTDASLDTSYTPFYTTEHPRANTIEGLPTKKTNENIIEIMNNLSVKNGATLTNALREYIERNYDYENLSDLYLGENAAYDIDELVALFRCVRTNPVYLTGNQNAIAYPFFTQQPSHREEVLRFATYFDGIKVHGSNSYGSRWAFNSDGQIEYTYSTEDFYNVISSLNEWNDEGLIYPDSLSDGSSTTNIRSILYGSDEVESNNHYGFMMYNFTASTTSDSLNKDVVAILPPVAEVNGVWQHYVDNTRTISGDGWAISAASSEGEISQALKLFNYFFTDDGYQLQNYGLPDMLEEGATFEGPDGNVYPKYTSWIAEQAAVYTKGDYSNFLRDVIGSLLPIGYQKEIGFEYQYTSQRGLDAVQLYTKAGVGMPSYAGQGKLTTGSNPNYYKLVPPAFSLNKNQSAQVSNLAIANDNNFIEVVFNVIRGLDPDKVASPQTYTEYLQYFEKGGLNTYVSVYQDAYAAMAGLE